jgi:N-methylhydantoinase B
MTVDVITVEVIGNNLQMISEEMGVVLVKAAYSTNIKERRDCSAALLDAQGETLAQAEHIPLHLGSMLGIVRQTVKNYSSEEIRPGDMFIANDTYVAGGTHLPDITVAAPFFYEGELLAFASNIGHHAEVGGVRATAKDAYDEGIRIPSVKIFREGTLDRGVLDFILLNCRLPRERLGDFRAQFSAAQLGVRRLQELCQKYGKVVFKASVDRLFDYAERKVRRGIEQIPDGRYEFSDHMDDDGVKEEPILIKVAVEVKGDTITCDFSGSGKQVEGPINMPISATLSSVYYAVKAVVDPNIEANGGYYRAIEVITEPGTILNPHPPAPVGGRSDTAQRVVDVILGALAQAIPARVTAACHGTIAGYGVHGFDSRLGELYTYIEIIGGGFGARCLSDGPDGVQVHMTNTSNLPVECLENEYPIRLEGYELIRDSGGAGKFRGGLGIRRRFRLLEGEGWFTSKGDRFRIAPWGLAGGHEGRKGRLLLNPDSEKEKNFWSKNYYVYIAKNDVLMMETPGGGGYGNPHDRDPALVAQDLVEEKIGLEEAQNVYLVVWDPQTKRIDLAATESLRHNAKC